MTRAVRVWAALAPWERERVEQALVMVSGSGHLIAALDADLEEHHRLRAALTGPPYQAFLVDEHQAGPRRSATSGACEACGKEVGTGLTAWITEDRTVLLLGPTCWRERSLGRAAARAGHQLELGTEEAP